MTAQGLYKIMDSFSTYSDGALLTIDGKEVESVTVTFKCGGFDDYHVSNVEIHTEKGDKE